MAKGNNTGKSRRSYSYKPYDASNSFVKRITSRVSEILPGPSWIRGWLSPAPQINIRQDRDDEDEEDEERQQRPPTKRIRLETSLNDFTHQNHVKRLSDLQDNSEELSPISRVDHRDGAVAGPSGLHLGSSNFPISSTPATTQTLSVVNKVNQGDDGSDSSESTSGCSSLVPQTGRVSASTALPNKLISTDTSHKIKPSFDFAQRLSSTPKDNFSKLNLSAGSNRPVFDSYVFHNPHNKSMNSSRSSQLDDSSPFYRGRTMYGGASANRETLNMSILSPASKPRVTNVKPVFKQVPERDTIGSSALRILRALEQMSTPVTEAKKMPLNASVRKRKPIQPFEELMIPQMSTLLRLKRKHRSESTMLDLNSNNESLAKDVPDLSITITQDRSAPNVVTPAVGSSTTTTTLTTPQFLPSYSIRKEESNKGEKFVTSIKGKDKDAFENERVPEVNLPNVKLNISTLPTFSLPTTASKTVTVHKSEPPSSVPKDQRIQPPPLESSTTKSSTLPKATTTTVSTSQFKFSNPIVESVDGHKISSIKHLFKFSNPLDANSFKKENELQIPLISMKEDTIRSTDMIMKSSTVNPKLKRKQIPEGKCNDVGAKKSINLQTGASIMDFFSKTNSGSTIKDKSSSPITSSSDSVSDTNTSLKSKPVPNESPKVIAAVSKSSESKWSCDKCLIENNNSDISCTKCGVTKFSAENQTNDATFTVKKEQVVTKDKCTVCIGNGDKKCVTCATEKSETSAASSVSSTTPLVPLSALFKKAAGSWECSVCLVTNKDDTDSCVSCSTPKPGAVIKTDLKSAPFQFGIPSGTNAGTSSGTSFSFGIQQTSGDSKTTNIAGSTTPAVGGFVFGSGTNAPTSVQEFKFGSLPPLTTSATETKEPETKVTFTFGKQAQETAKTEEKKADESKVSGKVFTFGNVLESDKGNGKREETKELVTNKDVQPMKKVSFKQQLVEEKIFSSDSSNAGGNFNNVFRSSSSTSKVEKPTGGSTFSFPSKTPLFGNVPSSTSDNPMVSSSLFKFGNSSAVTTTSPVTVNSDSASTAAVTTSTVSSSDNNKNISSTIATNSNSGKTSSTFSFLSNSTSKSLFPVQEPDKKESTVVFGGFINTNKTSHFSTNAIPSSTNFTFGSGTSTNDNKAHSEKEKIKKDSMPNSIFGEKRDSDLFNLQQKTEEKPNFFGNTKNEAKPMFFNANTNENVGGIFGNAKTEEWNPKPAFGSEPFETKSNATSSTTPLFGSSTTSMIPNSTETKSEPFGFNATSTQTNNISPFVFKGGDVADKPSGGFNFPAPANNQMQNTHLFGTNSQQQTQNVFGSSRTLFNTTAQPVNNTAAGSSFSFGTQPQQPQGIFGFSAQPQVPSGGTATMGETFTFGSSQNAIPQNTPVPPTGPPTFDPNIKPNFNFSGGATPTFSAQSSSLPAPVTKGKTERKIRKAVRRTLR